MPEKEIEIKNNSEMDIPDYAIEAIARSLLPIIQTYYESDAGKRDLAEWQAKQAKKCR
jgi:hypothetical protein